MASVNSVRLTANEICDYYNLHHLKSPINSYNLRKTYLNELNNAGYIEALDIREGNTKKVYYPIVALSEEAIHTNATKETKDSNNSPQFYTYYK
jgi:CRISPR/Cas system-associated endonuclease Cas1